MLKLLRSIVDEADAAKLPFIVIGGTAVNAFGHARLTLDIDLLLPRADIERWTALLEKFGYKRIPEQTTFAQFAPPITSMPPVDLMLVSDETFRKVSAAAGQKFIEDIPIRVPSPLHLIALKLHALRHGGPERHAKDLTDIFELMHLNHIDASGDGFKQICEKFGTPELYEQIRRSVEESES